MKDKTYQVNDVDIDEILQWCHSMETAFDLEGKNPESTSHIPKGFLKQSIYYLREVISKNASIPNKQSNKKSKEKSPQEPKEKFKICPGCCYSDGIENREDGSWICWRCGDEGEYE